MDCRIKAELSAAAGAESIMQSAPARSLIDQQAQLYVELGRATHYHARGILLSRDYAARREVLCRALDGIAARLSQ